MKSKAKRVRKSKAPLRISRSKDGAGPRVGPKGPPSKFALTCRKHEQLLRYGTVLVVDPSIGSRNSKPGFVLVHENQVIHSGTIEIDPFKPHHRRLHSLQTELYAITPAVDIIITEDIPPFMHSAGGGFRTKNVVVLHWAVGAILASYDAELIQVPIQSWHKWIRDNIGEFDKKGGYTKGDEKDALAMTCAVWAAAGLSLVNIGDVTKVLRDESPHDLEEV